MLFINDFLIQYVLLLSFFNPSKFFLNIFIIIEVGVTTPKKTIAITIGETILPRSIPNLNQSLFKGDKIDEFNKPKIKKTIEAINAQIMILPPLSNGNNEIIKKNIKKTIPKLLFDEILIFLDFMLIDIL